VKKIKYLIVLIVILGLVSCGLGNVVVPSTPTPYPDQPTYTPLPQQPTYTPLPPVATSTYIPTPPPESLYKYTIMGVEVQFKIATITTNAVTLGSRTFTPNTGFSVLIVSGTYVGDMGELFAQSGVYQPAGKLYVTDNGDKDREWVTNYRTWSGVETDGEFNIVFFVKTGYPYVLHNTVDVLFSINLSDLMDGL
jgi:hypothetical protein